jgi:hypothetical protein
MTGQRVLPTVHTNDAAGAIARLFDMAVEDYLLTFTTKGILGQRLVRTLCPACRIPYEAPPKIARTQQLIGPLTQHPALFRPFGGGILNHDLLSDTTLAHLCAEGSTCVLWNAVPRDWADPDGWVETALAQIDSQPWSLMVLHDLPTDAMRHLPRFLDTLRDTGCDIRQDFPSNCLHIVAGSVVRPIGGFVTAHGKGHP